MLVVTGADGFIGSTVVWHLNCQGRDDVVAVDTRKSLAAPRYLLRLAVRECIPHENLRAWLLHNRSRVEAIVHLGAITSTTEQDPSLLRSMNLEFSQGIWRVCVEQGLRLIYASSASTYGSGQHGFSDTIDLDLLQPLNLYARSKHDFDRWAAVQDRTPPQHVGLKFFNVYGPNEYHKGSMSSVIYRLAQDALNGSRIRIFSCEEPRYRFGRQARDFIYSKDVARVIDFFLAHPRISGLFNVGTGHSRTFNEVARAVAAALGKDPAVDYVDMPPGMRAHYQYFTRAEILKLRSAGFAAEFSTLERGVADYLSTYLAQGVARLSAPAHARLTV